MVNTIQLQDLPPHCTTVELGKEILGPVGDMLSTHIYTPNLRGGGIPFIKAIVKMDLIASFLGKIEAVVEGEPPFDIYLQYDGLSVICYLCGLLGHINPYCAHAATITPIPRLRGAWTLWKPFGHRYEEHDRTAKAPSK
ncbi:hypothetical protein LINGRAHAP2_LOCUS1772 [Linum grandiflorum]